MTSTPGARPPDHLAMVQYRLTTVEKTVEELQQKLSTYVPARENDLHLQSIRETVGRIERDVQAAKQQLGEVNTKIGEVSNKIITQDAAQRESQDKLLIRIMWFILATLISIVAGVLIFYFSQLLIHHP